MATGFITNCSVIQGKSFRKNLPEKDVRYSLLAKILKNKSDYYIYMYIYTHTYIWTY